MFITYLYLGIYGYRCIITICVQAFGNDSNRIIDVMLLWTHSIHNSCKFNDVFTAGWKTVVLLQAYISIYVCRFLRIFLASSDVILNWIAANTCVKSHKFSYYVPQETFFWGMINNSYAVTFRWLSIVKDFNIYHMRTYRNFILYSDNEHFTCRKD